MLSLSRFVFILGVVTIVMSGEAAAQNAQNPSDREAWEVVRTSFDPNELRKFISQFPQSSFTPVARGRLELLQRTRALEERERAVNLKLQRDERKARPERAAGTRSEEGRSTARKEQPREPAELARAGEDHQADRKERDEKRQAAQRAKTEAARLRAEKALRRFEEELAARKKVDRPVPDAVRPPGAAGPMPSPSSRPPSGPVATRTMPEVPLRSNGLAPSPETSSRATIHAC